MPGRPRAGGQYQECYLTLCPIKSSHPLRGATVDYPCRGRYHCISILAPLAGCDRVAGRVSGTLEISILAPLAGCDRKSDEISAADLCML